MGRQGCGEVGTEILVYCSRLSVLQDAYKGKKEMPHIMLMSYTPLTEEHPHQCWWCLRRERRDHVVFCYLLLLVLRFMIRGLSSGQVGRGVPPTIDTTLPWLVL